MGRRLYLLLGLIVCLFNGIRGEDKFPETPSPEVMYLFPEFLIIPAIEPALPAKYKAAHSRDPFDPRVYWGTGNGLNTYLLTGFPIKDCPVFSVRISENTLQCELNEAGVRKLIDEKFPALGLKNIGTRFLNWGQYPVVAMENRFDSMVVYSAWVGLNEPTGETLLINYLFPNGRGHPTAKEIKIWETFLNETKELPPQYYYITKGQDLHPGYTVVNLGPASFRVIAEVRKRDRAPLIAVEPLNENTMFTFKDMQEGAMGGEWNAGATAIKVTGTVTARNYIFDETSTVMVKEVDEFTVEPEALKKNPMNLVFDGQCEDQGNTEGP